MIMGVVLILRRIPSRVPDLQITGYLPVPKNLRPLAVMRVESAELGWCDPEPRDQVVTQFVV